MPQRLAGQLVDGGDPVADEPVFVVDTGPADESNWSIVATDRSAADGSWSVTVPTAEAERHHAVAQFEGGETLKNALSKPFLTSQPFAQAGVVSVGFDVLSPAVNLVNEIDYFERDDLDFYVGATSEFTIVDGGVQGDRCLAFNTTDTDFNGIVSHDGLPYYPEKGDRVSCYLRDESDDYLPSYSIGVSEDDDTIDSGYRVILWSRNNEVRVQLDPDEETILTFDSSISSGDWYDVETQWHDGSGSEPEDTLEVTIYGVDQSNGDRIEELNSGTVVDDTFAENTGVGFRNSSTPNSGLPKPMADGFRSLGPVG